MRRRVGLVLAGLGTCLIVFAVLMPTWVSGKVLKFPLNEYATATLTASNASYFSPAKLTEMTGVNMEATYTIKGNAAAGSSSTAVWDQFIYVYDQTNKLPFQTMTRTLAFNRRTAQLIDCCGANVNGDSSVKQTGIAGYVFPIGTQKQTYDVFDTNLNKPMPFTYAGTDTVNGIQAYRFTENVSPTQNGTQVLPGSLVGESQASVVLPQYYEMHLTYWIDPDTGALLNATENEKLTLRNSQGAQALLLLDANLAMTPASVNGLVALDNSQRSKMTLVTTILPLVTGIVGVILLIVGILLSRRRREDVEGGASVTSPELAAAEPEEDADRSAQPVTQPSLVPGLDDEPQEATAESPAVQEEAAQPEAEAEAEAAEPEAAQAEAVQPEAEAQAAEPEAAEPEAAEPEAAEPEAAEPEAVQPEAAEPEAAQADAPAAASAETPEAADAPAADAPAAEAQADAESPQAEDAPAEAPTAEMSAATSESPEAAAASAPADAPATTSRRGRRGSHRR
jgi:Porin PorA